MATQVRETSAGKSISAYIVLNRRKEHIATVNAHFSNGGTCTVDVWNIGDATAVRCMEAALKNGDLTDAKLETIVAASRDKRKSWGEQDHEGFAAFDLFGLQQGRAGGGGYDKFTAALSGLYIDGHKLVDHSATSKETESLLRRYRAVVEESISRPEGVPFNRDFQKTWDSKAARIGAYFTNYTEGGYISLYLKSGLDRLTTMGYDVIQAI